MLKNKRLTSGLLAVPLVTILLIAGCTVDSPKPSESPTSAPSISAPANPTASPAPTATEAPPAPAAEVGAVVDQATADALNKESGGQYRGYVMPDGSNVIVDKSAPLPEVVQQDINNKGDATISGTLGSPKDSVSAGALANRQKLMNDVSNSTGKRAIFGLRVTVYASADSETPTTWYIFNGPFRSPQPNYPDRGSAEAAVNDWLASQPNPNDYVVIWG